MTAQRSFASALGSTIECYLGLKEASGLCFATERRILTHLDGFLSAAAADLTVESFTAWCLTHEHMKATVRRNRMRIARNVCLYRQRTDPACFVPDASQFPAKHQPVRPHIFTEAEIASLLLACDQLSSAALLL